MTDRAEVVGSGSSADETFARWESLSWESRRARRFSRWLDPPAVEFASLGVRQRYRERVQAAIDAITLKKPSRVPVNLFLGVYPARWAGVTIRDAMYDCERFAPLWGRFHEEFGLDFVEWPIEPGRPMELLGAKYVVWPGHGLADDAPWQYTSEENMLPDEYEMLIDDPSDYWLRVYLPRVVEAFEPLAGLYPFTQMYQANKLVARLTPLADRHVVAALRSLTAAAESYVKYTETYSAVSRDLTARCGLPEFIGSSLFAPYDILADTLRGTKGIVLDLFAVRRRLKLRPRVLSEAWWMPR